MDLLRLKDKFKAENIEWRIGRCGLKKDQSVWATALAYVDNRAIQNRLDDVCGQFNWKNEFIRWKEKSQLCGISIYCEEKNEWITKWDGADDSGFESTKGGLSVSMKRASYQWGVGRYLYDIPESFVVTTLIKTKGLKYQPESKKKNIPAFYWDTPTIPDWALPGTIPITTEKPDKGDPEKDVFVIDKKNNRRYNKTRKTLCDEYQRTHGLIGTAKWVTIEVLIKSKIRGDIEMFTKWLMATYGVKFYDIPKDKAADIMSTLRTCPNHIIDSGLV